jgi:hypothetical protein
VPALIVTILYAILPGHPDLSFPGLPLAPLELAALVLLTCLALAVRRRSSQPHLSWTPVSVVAAAALVKVLVAFAWHPAGWLASYYANDAFTPPVERSLDYLPWPLSRAWRNGATRIDSAIDYRGTAFPVHFLNDARFAHGARRELAAAFSAEWRGVFESDRLTLTLVLEARGWAELLVDDRRVLLVDSPAADGQHREELQIPRGRHSFTVRYRKPANAEGFLRLLRFDAGTTGIMTDPRVFPFREFGWRRHVAGLLRAAGWMTHGAVVLAIGSWLSPLLRQRAREMGALAAAARLRAAGPLVLVAATAGLAAQGVVTARPFVNRVAPLDARDPASAYEAQARQILASGPTASAAATGYFLAAVHAVSGESLAGVVFAAFMLFALSAAAIYRFVEAVAGARVALAALGGILVLQQMAIDRFGPFALLRENLYFTLAALAVLAVAATIQRARSAQP